MVGETMKLFKKKSKKMEPERSKVEVLEELIALSEKVLLEIENEKRNPTLWRLDALKDIVEPEMSEILKHAKNGEIFFKYNNQKLLESAYYMTDTADPLNSTKLGCSINKLQSAYFKL